MNRTTPKRTPMTPREAAAKREIVDHNCAVCGAHFRGIKTGKFCSNRCKQADKNRKARSGPLLGADHRVDVELGSGGQPGVAPHMRGKR